MAPAQLTLFGGFQIRLASGQVIDLQGQKDRALLAFLALPPGTAHSRDKLAGLLWGDRGDRQARDSLKHSLTRLRKCFGPAVPPPIVSDRRSVSLDPAAVIVDVATFERLLRGAPEALEQATVLYRGELLDGLNVRDPAFEDWLLVERQRLHQLAEAALTELLAWSMAAGERDRAAAAARRLLSLDPLREAACRALMQIHAEQAQTAQALKLFETLRDRLHRELGVKPEPETMRLYESILQRRAAPAVRGAESLSAEAIGRPEPSPAELPPAALSDALPPPSGPSIAVLPFANLSGDPEQEYFSDGITEDIITELARFRSLLVVARNSSFAFKGKAVKVQEIAKGLDVAYVVHGGVQKAAARIRITAQLVDGATGMHIWAERYDRDLEDIFAVQDEVTRAIVSALPVRLGEAAIERMKRIPTQNLTAYDYLLRARWAQWHNTGDKRAAFDWLRKAISADPEFASAHALLAYSHAYGIFTLGLSVDDASNQARKHAERALAIDDSDAFIHAMVANTYSICGEHALARIHSDRAIELNPNDIYAMSCRGFVLTNAGDPSAGLEWYLRAQRLVPRASDDTLFEDLFDCYYCMGDYGKAIESFERWLAPLFHMYPFLAAAYAQLGRSAEAQLAVAEYERRRPPEYDLRNLLSAALRSKKRQVDRDRFIEGFGKAGLAV